MAAQTSVMTGVFRDRNAAMAAVDQLVAAGVSVEDISLVTSREDDDASTGTMAGTGAVVGGTVGGAAGALLAGLTAVGTLSTGGLGLLAAGPIVAALAGAGAGAATGGLVGALIGLGIPEEEAAYYEGALQQGWILVTVKTNAQNRGLAERVLASAGATLPGQATTRKTTAPQASGKSTYAAAYDDKNGNGLRHLLVEQLKDMYYAERKIMDGLEQMTKSARLPTLKQAFEEHLRQTDRQVARLEAAFGNLGVKPEERKCHGINGILDEAQELMRLDLVPGAHDAALVCAAQKVEHYEIGTYGSIRAYAQLLGNHEVAELMNESLDEEKAADRKLTHLAETHLNPAGASA